MDERSVLSKSLDVKTFRSYYYLKNELVAFCRQEKLQATGGKIELTERIAAYIDTGEKLFAPKKQAKAADVGVLTYDVEIETPFVCSERHRAFFVQEIGASFSFNVMFQKWLKNNSGKTYQEAIEAYHKIIEEKKSTTTVIDKQFEYNTYIRAFFADNQGLSLQQAIQCWRYKKALPGKNEYEQTDLIALK